MPGESLKLGVGPPKVAPALYKERRRSEFRNPAHFILHYYGPYLGKRGEVLGMILPDIRQLDVRLYEALRGWLRFEHNRRNPDWLALKERLPTLPERNDEIIAALLEGRGVPGMTVELLVALAQAVHRRKKNHK